MSITDDDVHIQIPIHMHSHAHTHSVGYWYGYGYSFAGTLLGPIASRIRLNAQIELGNWKRVVFPIVVVVRNWST